MSFSLGCSGISNRCYIVREVLQLNRECWLSDPWVRVPGIAQELPSEEAEMIWLRLVYQDTRFVPRDAVVWTHQAHMRVKGLRAPCWKQLRDCQCLFNIYRYP